MLIFSRWLEEHEWCLSRCLKFILYRKLVMQAKTNSLTKVRSTTDIVTVWPWPDCVDQMGSWSKRSSIISVQGTNFPCLLWHVWAAAQLIPRYTYHNITLIISLSLLSAMSSTIPSTVYHRKHHIYRSDAHSIPIKVLNF